MDCYTVNDKVRKYNNMRKACYHFCGNGDVGCELAQQRKESQRHLEPGCTRSSEGRTGPLVCRAEALTWAPAQSEPGARTHHTGLEQPSGSTGTPSVTNRMNTMMKIFENQTTMLEKALSDQTEAEAKYKKMETNVQLLVMEKALLKGEIRRLREIQKAKATSKEVRPKKSGKSEKKKDR
eukprot:XP_017448563.1 PREDICTED: coiled-coil domain-containing protein 7-like [Rattus norvegicus]